MSALCRSNLRQSRERGFILALGLLMLAALALIGTAALSTAYFQNDMANNVRENQEAYYVATVGLSTAVEHMMFENPGNVRTIQGGGAYLMGNFDRTTGAVTLLQAGCTPGNHRCVCASIGRQKCFDFYVEVELRKCGHPHVSSVEATQTLFFHVSSTATGFHGNSSNLHIDVAGTYPGQCAMDPG